MTDESVPHESDNNNTPDNKPTWLALALKGRLAEIEREAPYNPVPTVSEPDLTGYQPYCPDLYKSVTLETLTIPANRDAYEALKELAATLLSQGMVQEFFGKTGRDAVMVAPFNEDGFFIGKYPSSAWHTCKTIGAIDGDETSIELRRLGARLWRERVINGFIIPACPACRHNHIWRLCQQIEHEVMDYQAWNVPLRFALVDDLEKTIATAKKRSQRKGEKLRYCAIPQSNGGVVIHDQPDNLGGEMLPNDRTGLITLMGSWIDDQPDDSRLHVSEGWGREFQGDRPKKRGGKRQEQQQDNDNWKKLLTRSYARAKTLIEGAYGVKITRANARVEIGISDVIELLRAAGLEFVMTSQSEGKVCPDLRLSINNTIGVSRDKCITETPDSEIDQMLPLFPKAEMKGL